MLIDEVWAQLALTHGITLEIPTEQARIRLLMRTVVPEPVT